MKTTLEKLTTLAMEQSIKIALPENYHQGLRLPARFELPDNILCFFHNFTSEERQHNRYCLVFPFDPFTYLLNKNKLHVTPGCVIIQKPYAPHGILHTQKNCRRLQISFELKGETDFFPKNTVVSVSSKSWHILSRVLRNFQQKKAAACAMELYSLCQELLGNQQSLPIDKEKTLIGSVDQLTEFPRGRLENIASLAQSLGMSESNLRLLFRKENHISLGKFIQRRKLEIAQYRLKYSRQTVTEISRACGYSSVFSFCRFFKSHTGITPKQWRSRNLPQTDWQP